MSTDDVCCYTDGSLLSTQPGPSAGAAFNGSTFTRDSQLDATVLNCSQVRADIQAWLYILLPSGQQHPPTQRPAINPLHIISGRHKYVRSERESGELFPPQEEDVICSLEHPTMPPTAT